jgi:hypothetical protein
MAKHAVRLPTMQFLDRVEAATGAKYPPSFREYLKQGTDEFSDWRQADFVHDMKVLKAIMKVIPENLLPFFYCGKLPDADISCFDLQSKRQGGIVVWADERVQEYEDFAAWVKDMRRKPYVRD